MCILYENNGLPFVSVVLYDIISVNCVAYVRVLAHGLIKGLHHSLFCKSTL